MTQLQVISISSACKSVPILFVRFSSIFCFDLFSTRQSVHRSVHESDLGPKSLDKANKLLETILDMVIGHSVTR